MRTVFLLFLSLLLFTNTNVFCQKMSGAPPNASLNANQKYEQGINRFIAPKQTAVDSFTTSVYTFGDIIIFTYFDNTYISVYNSYGSQVGSATLKADTIYYIKPGQGLYRIVGNISYTVLIGDAITNYVNGYYAVDEAGRGVSTKLNTWMMNSYYPSQDEFAVFAYEDNTSFTVKNLQTGNLLYAGTLNAGKHFSFREYGAVPYNTPIQVSASKGVSVLSYSDQDYYVPSANGRFTGNLFYGYSAYEGEWQNSVTITSYSDNNTVNIYDTNGDVLLGTFTLGKGQVSGIGITSPVFWKVTSTGTVSAANIPYIGWSGDYSYMTRAIDETGVGAGKLFYVPTISSRIDVFSFENDNNVTITQLGTMNDYPYSGTQTVVWSGVLNAMDNYHFSSQFGNYVYKIEGTKNLSVLQSNNGWGADFMPLSYALSMADLVVSNPDINFSIPDSVYVAGDQITVTVKVHNSGTIAAENIHVYAYDGDPDLGTAPLLSSDIINYIAAGGNGTITFKYIVPLNPQYRSIVVKVDPGNLITEANKSNNKASRFLRPNFDLLPPLAVNVTAPSGLVLDNGLPYPNPFIIKYDIFNTGNVSAVNTKLVLHLKNGLKLLSGVQDTTINFGNIDGYQSANYKILVNANADSSGFNFYSASISADNAVEKDVNRVINIPDGIEPAVPENIDAVSNDGGCVTVSWKANSEKDLSGYLVFITDDSLDITKYNPVIVVGTETITKCSLPSSEQGKTFYVFVKAFDSSNNLSLYSKMTKVFVKGTVSGIEDQDSETPSVYRLSQNYPNPFNPTTVIEYSLPVESNVILRVFDILGNEISVLVNKVQSAGNHNVVFDARNLTNGIYFYSIQANEFRQVKKLVLLK